MGSAEIDEHLLVEWLGIEVFLRNRSFLRGDSYQSLLLSEDVLKSKRSCNVQPQFSQLSPIASGDTASDVGSSVAWGLLVLLLLILL